MAKLSEKVCVPCQGGIPALKGEELRKLLDDVEGWGAVDEHHLTKTFVFENFAEALAFTNRVGHLAEQEDHHPDIHLSWGKVQVNVWTHKVNGLTENDFILAAKIDEL